MRVAKSLALTALFTFFILGCMPTNLSKTKSELGGDRVSLESNKEIVDLFFKRVTAGKIDAAFELVDDNVSWWVPGNLPFSGTKSKTEYLVVVNQITKGFPTGFELMATSMIAEADKVAAEVVSNGTHVNGKKYNNHYHFLIQVRDGKMINVKEYMDTLHLYQLIAP